MTTVMTTVKITEKPVAEIINNDAYLLGTQKNGDGQQALYRFPLQHLKIAPGQTTFFDTSEQISSKNLINPSDIITGAALYKNSSGEIVLGVAAQYKTTGLIPVSEGSYYFSMTKDGTTCFYNANVALRWCLYSDEATPITSTYTTSTALNGSIQIAAEQAQTAKYMRLSVYTDGTACPISIDCCQLEKSEKQTLDEYKVTATFHPYFAPYAGRIEGKYLPCSEEYELAGVYNGGEGVMQITHTDADGFKEMAVEIISNGGASATVPSASVAFCLDTTGYDLLVSDSRKLHTPLIGGATSVAIKPERGWWQAHYDVRDITSVPAAVYRNISKCGSNRLRRMDIIATSTAGLPSFLTVKVWGVR